jgi:predicted ATP-dependent endonuclease of OLD family
MKIRQITLKNFKRFTDATIGEIPAEARIVLVVGPNGCGKSSLVDAVNLWFRHHWARAGGWDEHYHRKQVVGATETWNQAVQVTFHDPQP